MPLYTVKEILGRGAAFGACDTSAWECRARRLPLPNSEQTKNPLVAAEEAMGWCILRQQPAMSLLARHSRIQLEQLHELCYESM